MDQFHQLIAWVASLATGLTSFLGYPGIFVLMAMESMVIPLPSEMVMPFAGFLVSAGRFNFWLVVLASTLGSLVGSLISYYMGKYGGKILVAKWGKFLLLSENDLQKTEKWFEEKGEFTIFIGRFIPVVRHLISLPAGAGNMDLKKFCLFTVLGAGVWNAFLTYLGLVLGNNFELVRRYSEFFSLPAAVIVIVAIIYFLWRHFKK